MKTKEKRVGTKAQIRAIKERERRLATAVFLVFILFIAAISVYFAYTFLNQPQNQTINPTFSQLKAAIVDHLSLTFPNQTFIQTATNILKQAGYTVDYYPGEQITVEFYRNLPTHGYRLIILRVHSAITKGSDWLGLFTSEQYDVTKYVYEQLVGELVVAVYSEEDREKGNVYFGISPLFVTQSMNGRFENAVIIIMGCEGLTYPAMAEAFIEKGAKVYISWNKGVLASHTDQATTHLLRHLIVEKQTIRDAVRQTMKEIGPDPVFNSKLLYYPVKSGDYQIPDTPEG